MSGVQTPSSSSGPGGSPSFLPGRPKRGAGVRRLNHVPIMCGVALLCAVVGAVGYTYDARIMATAAQQASAEKRGEAGKPTVLDGAPDGGVIPAGLGSNKPMGNSGNAGGDQAKPAPTPTPAGSPPSDTGAGRQVDAEDDATKARRQAWLVYYQQLAELQKQRYDGATQAMRADTGVGGSAGGGASNPQPIGGTPSMDAPGGQQAMQMPPGMGGPGGAYGGGYGGAYGGYAPAPAVPDATGAREKQAFLAQRGSDGSNDTLLATVRDPISPYLITAGDVIPVVMQGGADSDIPGQMVGRVVADVFDSATGQHRLIPAHSKVVGIYDNVVSAGQSRLPAIINRIIFPDSSSIAIGAMPAADGAGFAGLRDQLDRHVWEKFGNALVVAVAGAGVQLSQPQGRSRDGYDSQQLIAGSLGQQFGQLGQEYARSGLAIPNTIRIRPGYRFTIQVTKDMVLRPYVDGRTRGAQQVHYGPFVQ